MYIQRAVAEILASLDTFSTAVAKIFIDGILEIWFLDEFAGYCTGGTHLILCSRADGSRTLPEVSTAEVAITAHLIIIMHFTAEGVSTQCVLHCPQVLHL